MSGEALLVDDHLLLQVLFGAEPKELRPSGATLWTTGLWYHRLCRALSNETVIGAMSGALAGLDPNVARQVVRNVIELPESIGLLSLRDLGWSMAGIVADGARLNLLSREALAAAVLLDATLCLAGGDYNPPLVEAAGRRGVTVRLI